MTTFHLMLNGFNAIVKVLLLTCCSVYAGHTTEASPGLGERSIRDEYRAFFRYFEPRDTLFFDYSNLIMGDITHFVYMGKTCAVFDQISGSLFYVDLQSKQFRTLTTEDSLPGYHMRVVGMVRFGEDGFVVAADPYYYIWFGEDGKIRRVFETGSYQVSPKFALGHDRIIIYYHPTPDQLSLLALDMRSGKVRTLFPLREVGKNLRNLLFSNTINGGFLYDGNSRYFVADPYENLVYVYNTAGRLIDTYRSKYRNFRKVQRDVATPSPTALMQFMRESRKHPFDMVFSMHFLNSRTLLVAYAIRKKLYVELFDKDSGEVLNHEAIRVPFPLKYCSDNSLFLEGPPRAVRGKEIGNPYLIRFVVRTGTKQ